MARAGVVSITEVAKVPRRELEGAIAEVLQRQHGVVTLRQFEALGLSAPAVRARARSGRLTRLHRGVYAVAGARLSPHAHWLAAVMACGPHAVLSHRSAAALWGIRRSAATIIDVMAPGRTGRRRPGLRVHAAARLSVDDVDIVAGIPCTSAARTLVDLAAVVPLSAFEYALHRAQSQRLVSRAEMAAVLERSPRLLGATAVRKVLALQGAGEDDVRSDNERRLLRICRRAGVPSPRVNFWIALPDGVGIEVDFAWPELRLAVEVDSRRYHATERAFVNDRSRDRRLVAAGWRVVRFSEDDLLRPFAVEQDLRRLTSTRAVSRTR